MSVTGVVLAGGLSRRMGRDKATVRFGGHSLIEIALRSLREAGCDDVVVLHRDPLFDVDARVRRDLGGGQGPLDGLVTALTCAETSVVVTLPVDLPRVSGDVLRAAVGRLRDRDDVDAALLWDGGDSWQHLAGAWRVERCREVLSHSFASGERSARRAVSLLAVDWRVVPVATLHNVNTPSDAESPPVA